MNPTISNVNAAFRQPGKIKDITSYYQVNSLAGVNVPSFYQRDYFSPFNLLFLSKLEDLSLFLHETIFLVRDGLYPMLCFFLKHPTPPAGMKSLLLLPEPFLAFVPEKWRVRSFHYSYKVTPPKALVKSSSVILIGHIAAETFNLAQALTSLQQYALSEELLFLAEDSLPPAIVGQMGVQTEAMELKRQLYPAMPANLRFLEDRQIYGLSCHTGWTYGDLDRNLFVYDKWSNHYFSALGLQNADKSSSPGELSLAINLFEKIMISSIPQSVPNYFNDLYIEQKLLKILPADFSRFVRGRIRRHFSELF